MECSFEVNFWLLDFRSNPVNGKTKRRLPPTVPFRNTKENEMQLNQRTKKAS
jgi:hypothetical protein